jgi:adenylylsulfate kinase
VYVDVPLDVAEKRDPKGLYKKARNGVISEFTGISAPYEAPENPNIHIRADKSSVEESVRQIIGYLEKRGLLPSYEDNGGQPTS